ncbi:MAG: TfoX/Sxy family protein [Candidatus Binataceae bacterium]
MTATRRCRKFRRCHRWASPGSPRAYDAALAARVRRALASRDDVAEKPMLGGLTFMVAGKMCCGLIKDELVIRLGATTVLAELRSPDVRVCDFTKRPMRGLFVIRAQGCADQRKVNRWVRRALRCVLSPPPR